MVKRSTLEINLGILHTIKEGKRKGEKVGSWYIQRNLMIGPSTFRKYENFLTEKGFIVKEEKQYSLTDKANDVIEYIEKIYYGLKENKSLESIVFEG